MNEQYDAMAFVIIAVLTAVLLIAVPRASNFNSFQKGTFKKENKR